MKRLPTATLLLATGLLGLAAGLRADRAAPVVDETVRYVQVNQILRDLPAFKAGVEALQAKYAAEAERLSVIADELRGREAGLRQLDPQSAEYVLGELRLKADQEVTTREAEFLRMNQARELDTLIERTVRMIHMAAGTLGERNGWAAVLMAPGDFVDLEVGTIGDSLEDLDTRWVMWVHPDRDVTAQVMAILTEEG